MTDHLEKPDHGENYVVMVKSRDYCVDGKCRANCLEELKACTGYNPNAFVFMSGCAYCGRSGKCLRPEK